MPDLEERETNVNIVIVFWLRRAVLFPSLYSLVVLVGCCVSLDFIQVLEIFREVNRKVKQHIESRFNRLKESVLIGFQEKEESV